MRILIIEDEKPAAQKLQKAISRKMNADLLGVIGSVEESVNWLEQNSHPDLIFMDIQLSDGISFKIFDRVELRCPVIFTTAFDDYWQKAFEYNSIDYLLKPVKQEKLEIALSKYESLRQHFSQQIQQLLQWQQQPATPAFKKRFLIKRGADYISLRVEDLAYFYAAHKVVCLVDKQGQKYVMDESLADIEKQLDPTLFYRINRKYLVHQPAIKRIRVYPKSKLQIELEPAVQEEIIISQENVNAFKAWMGD